MFSKSDRIVPNISSMEHVLHHVNHLSSHLTLIRLYNGITILIFRFFLYYQYYPERLKYNNDESDSISHDWRLSLRIRSSLKIYSTILAILIVLIAMIIGLPSGIGKVSAWVLGIFSMILSIFQFLPQIYQTYKHKVLENI